jgi:hypothetical protein
MLGRLQLPLAEAEKQYLQFSEELFQPKHSALSPVRAIDLVRAKGKYDHLPLEAQIKTVTKQRTGSEDTLLRDDSGNKCHV